MHQKGFYLCRISFILYIDEQILREYTYFTKKVVTCILSVFYWDISCGKI